MTLVPAGFWRYLSSTSPSFSVLELIRGDGRAHSFAGSLSLFVESLSGLGLDGPATCPGGWGGCDSGLEYGGGNVNPVPPGEMDVGLSKPGTG